VARFDVVVVGGGPAGCVAAARLSEDAGRRVCLLEGGPDYGAYGEGRWPADLLDAREITLAHVWPASDPDRTKLRPRVIGGGSSVNACNVALGAAPDYDWGGGWSLAALEPYAARAAKLLRARRFGREELGDWHRRFLDAAIAQGLDAEPSLVNRRGDVRWNAAFAYLDPARDRPNLEIRGDSTVVRLEPPRVHLADGSAVEAPLVVLAAGAYGTPALLQASGLGGPQLGANLADHPGFALRWPPVEPPPEPATMSQVVLRLRTSRARDEHWDVCAYTAESGGERAVILFSMTPVSRGSVTLADDGPAVDHGFLADEDAARLVEAAGTVRELLGAEAEPGEEADLDAYIRANVRGFFHPVGTCALGSVVDTDGLLDDGVAVCDASVIPRVPRAPTHLTVLAVAERIVQALA
jgi:choline dehydrogenase